MAKGWIKTKYLRRWFVITFYWNKPFSIMPYPEDGIDMAITEEETP